MFIALLNPGLQNGNSILTVQQGAQVFFSSSPSPPQRIWSTNEGQIADSFSLKIIQFFFLTNRFSSSSWRHLWNTHWNSLTATDYFGSTAPCSATEKLVSKTVSTAEVPLKQRAKKCSVFSFANRLSSSISMDPPDGRRLYFVVVCTLKIRNNTVIRCEKSKLQLLIYVIMTFLYLHWERIFCHQ